MTYFMMFKWLQDFAYKISIVPMVFVLAAALTLIIAVPTVGYHSFKNALANPVGSLCYD
ncbi:MAG: hypothetical protein J7L72_02040 [Candidatus Aminicenantes bacterium]|nr:hypothetical protein [Candidatus Aminicenantes bacterium]